MSQRVGLRHVTYFSKRAVGKSRVGGGILRLGGEYARGLDGNHLYVGTFDGVVVKVDPSTFKVVDGLFVGKNIHELLIVGNYLYVAAVYGGEVFPEMIYKVDLSSFTVVSSIRLIGFTWCYSLIASGNYLYVSSWMDPGQIAKIDLTTFTHVSTLTLGAGEDHVATLEVSGGYLYAGIWAFAGTGKVVKIDLATFTKIATLDLGMFFAWQKRFCHALEAVGGYLYACWKAGAGIAGIEKIDLATFTSVGSINWGIGSEEHVWDLSAVGGYLYGSGNTRVYKIDLTTFTYDSSRTIDEGDRCFDLFTQNNDLYVTLNSNSGALNKFNLVTWTKVAHLPIVGDDYIYGLESYGDYLYAGIWTAAGKIVKVNPNTLAWIDHLVLDPLSDESYVSSLKRVGNYLYASLDTDSPAGKITKIDLTTFTKVSTLNLGAGEDYPYGLVDYNGYLYAGLWSWGAGKIVKIDLATFTQSGTLNLAGDENYPLALAVSAGYLYAGCGTSPAKIVKVDLSSFTQVGTLTLNAGEDDIWKDGITINGNYLYAGCTTAPGKIVKVDLTTFTRIAGLDLNPGENFPSVAMFNGYLYGICYTSPGIVVEIDPSGTLTRLAAINLLSGESYPVSHHILGDILYIGTDTGRFGDAGRIVKIG